MNIDTLTMRKIDQDENIRHQLARNLYEAFEAFDPTDQESYDDVDPSLKLIYEAVVAYFVFHNRELIKVANET